MSESLFYNRDQNISGITVPSELSGMNFTPVYGSKVDFSANNYKYNTDDFYYNLVPLSLNSLTATFSVRYDVNESGARDLATFFESKSGFKPLEFTPDNSVIYQTVSGFCDNYAINFINNQHFEVAANVNVDGAPTLLNWVSGNFADVPFLGWISGASYSKYDVVYYPFNAGLTANKNKLDNFYYCSGDHDSSSPTNSPTGTASLWSQKFFFEPDIGVQNNVDIKADVLNYKNSFTQRLKINNNIATFDMSYTYTNITDNQLKGMLHFLERKGGYRRFEHQIPSVYNRPKVYYCPSWSHTWNYFNSNTLTVNLIEDPLGVIPKEVSTTPAWNTTATAYIEAVEADLTDPFTFTSTQKVAISIFLDQLYNLRLLSSIKKMWLVGFNPYGGQVNLMDPTDVESWSAAPLAGDMHNGFATFANENMETNTMSELGIDHENCGAFFAGTNMTVDPMDYIFAGDDSGGSVDNFILAQRFTSTIGRFGEIHHRPAYIAQQDGVFVGTRNGDDVHMIRVLAARRTSSVSFLTSGGTTPTDSIALWGGNTVGNVSTVGITSGLTADQAKILGELLYDLCVSIGHTALRTQDS